jgi:putative exosortase-associated protein (TIGR04073 family)
MVMRAYKRIVFFVLAGILMAAQGLYAEASKFAQEGLYVEDNAATKLGRGFTNIVLSPGEYVVQTAKLMGTNDPVTAYCGGFAMGTWKMMERIGGGFYEVFTFPFPHPKRKYGPLMDPPTVAVALQESGVLNAN